MSDIRVKIESFKGDLEVLIGDVLIEIGAEIETEVHRIHDEEDDDRDISGMRRAAEMIYKRYKSLSLAE